MEKFIGRLVYN